MFPARSAHRFESGQSSVFGTRLYGTRDKLRTRTAKVLPAKTRFTTVGLLRSGLLESGLWVWSTYGSGFYMSALLNVPPLIPRSNPARQAAEVRRADLLTWS